MSRKKYQYYLGSSICVNINSANDWACASSTCSLSYTPASMALYMVSYYPKTQFPTAIMMFVEPWGLTMTDNISWADTQVVPPPLVSIMPRRSVRNVARHVNDDNDENRATTVVSNSNSRHYPLLSPRRDDSWSSEPDIASINHNPI
ncbi:hypothetical protein RRF57_004913 [Xylaria bambusicola]|uniref:Uncharacterized protein n=1 Tax=Xylaria bambusicola TaxID=326684 RepID=A0AAN7Z785_9PEZI